MELFGICLKSTFTSFQDDIYEQTCGVTMESPLSPMAGNVFMERFEECTFNFFHLKSKWWVRHMDNTNVNWLHGKASLDMF
jgi:hypothetical protein